jgi:ankyrin repeat protein
MRIAQLIIAKFPAIVTITNDRGDTPLHNAVFQGELEMAKLFLEHGAKVNAENNDGQTSLEMAKKMKSPYPEMIDLLKEYADKEE